MAQAHWRNEGVGEGRRCHSAFYGPSDTSTGRASRSEPQPFLRLLILVAMAWTSKRFETVSFYQQPGLSRSMVQWAQAWVDCISTNQRVVKRPRGCRMVCWRSGRKAPNHIVAMVRLPVHPDLLCFW